MSGRAVRVKVRHQSPLRRAEIKALLGLEKPQERLWENPEQSMPFAHLTRTNEKWENEGATLSLPAVGDKAPQNALYISNDLH